MRSPPGCARGFALGSGRAMPVVVSPKAPSSEGVCDGRQREPSGTARQSPPAQVATRRSSPGHVCDVGRRRPTLRHDGVPGHVRQGGARLHRPRRGAGGRTRGRRAGRRRAGSQRRARADRHRFLEYVLDAGFGGRWGQRRRPRRGRVAGADSPPGPSTAPPAPTDAGKDSPTTTGASTAPQMHVESSGGVNTSTHDAGQATDEDVIPPAGTTPEVDAAPPAGTKPEAGAAPPAAGTEADGASVGTEDSVAHHDSVTEEPTPTDTVSTAGSGESAHESDADLTDTAQAPDSGDVSPLPAVAEVPRPQPGHRTGPARRHRVHHAGEHLQRGRP